MHPRESGALVPVLAAAILLPAYVHVGMCARPWAPVCTYTHLSADGGVLPPHGPHMNARMMQTSTGVTHTHTHKHAGFCAKAHGAHVSVDAAPPGPGGSCWPHAPLKRAVTSRLESMISSFLDVLGHVGCTPSCRQRSCPGSLLGVPGRAGRGLSLELPTLLQAGLCWAWPSQTRSALS